MSVEIALNCDVCGKSGLIVSPHSGVIYCQWCRMSYGESIYDSKEMKKK